VDSRHGKDPTFDDSLNPKPIFKEQPIKKECLNMTSRSRLMNLLGV